MSSRAMSRGAFPKIRYACKLFCMTALMVTCLIGVSSAAGIRLVSSVPTAGYDDSFTVDVVAEGIPTQGLGTVQFRLNALAPNTSVNSVSDLAQANAGEVSIVTPLLIGPATSGRSGIGDFFWNARSVNGILVMDNETLQNGAARFSLSHTNGAVLSAGSGTIVRFLVKAGSGISADHLTLTLSDSALLNGDDVFPLDYAIGAEIQLRCKTKMPTLLGLSYADAVNALTAAHLSAGTIYEIDNANGSLALNVVLEQSIAAGSNMFCGTTINMAVNTPPSGTLSINGGAAYTGTPSVALTLTCADTISGCSHMQFSNDNLAWSMVETYTTTKAWSLVSGNGPRTVYVKYVDAAGNISGAYNASITLDMIPPTTTVTPPAGVYGSIQTVLLSANEPATIYYTTDGSIPTTASPIYTGPIMVTHTSLIRFFALSGYGRSEDLRSSQYTIDIQSPTLTLSTLPDGAYTHDAVLNIAGTVTDDNTVQALTINNNTVTLGADGAFSQVLTLMTGSNTITVSAVDTAGNTATNSRTIILDQTVPVITIAEPSDNSVTNNVETFISGTVDKTATVNLRINGMSPVPDIVTGGTFSFSITLAYGQNTIDVTATDLAMNSGMAKRTVTRDNVNPVLAVTNPAQDVSTNQSSIMIEGTVADLTGTTVTITWDGIVSALTVSNGTFQQQLLFTGEKTYAVIVTATDAAGNTTTVQRNIIYDTTNNSSASCQVGYLCDLTCLTEDETSTYSASISITSASDCSAQNCSSGDTLLSFTCSPPVQCTYTYASWGSCTPNGYQYRNVSSASPAGCNTGDPDVYQSCVYIPCTYTYSSWSDCSSDYTQSRSVTSVSPSGCDSSLPVLTQACVYSGPVSAPFTIPANTAMGDFLYQWGGDHFYNPYGVAVDQGGNVYVADTGNGRVKVFNSSGTYLRNLGSDDRFSSPAAIAVDSSGNVYVVDNSKRNIQVFNSSGVFLRSWGSTGSGDGQFNSPRGIALDSSGNVYVTDAGYMKVQVFSNIGTFLRKFGSSGSGNGMLSNPMGIAVDASGNVYVADYSNNRVEVFSNTGTFLRTWGTYGRGNGTFDRPYGISVDSIGSVYVTDANGRVQVFSITGTYLRTLSSFGYGNGQLYNPTGIALDSSGNIYVADLSYGGRIQVFTNTGTFTASWGEGYAAAGQFWRPGGIAAASSGNIFVADTNNQRIEVFSGSGTFLRTWGGQWPYPYDGVGVFDFTYGVAVDAIGTVYVADIGYGTVKVFSNSGTFLRQLGTPGNGDGQFSGPSGIAVDSDGNVYVADFYNNNVQVFTNTGSFLTQWGTLGAGDGQFNFPYGIAVDSSENIFVADTNNNRIQVFSKTGTFLRAWGTYGSGPAQFNRPYGIAVDTGGNVYVADTFNNRVQVFSSTGTLLGTWGTVGSDPGQFKNPWAIAVNSFGNVYVTDTGNSRVQVFVGACALTNQCGQ